MRRKWMSIALSSAVLAGTALYIRSAVATPASGFVGTTLALGRLGEIDVFNQFVPHDGPPWISIQKTKGQSDLYVQNNVWQPNGSTGWHSHPGHSLIIVTAGTIADYEPDAAGCQPAIYTQGMSFVDPGGDHVHNIRNETGSTASTVTVQLIPAGAARRIDAPQPANCPVF